MKEMLTFMLAIGLMCGLVLLFGALAATGKILFDTIEYNVWKRRYERDYKWSDNSVKAPKKEKN